MSDTDKADGVICLDSEEDGTPPKKKGTVKEKEAEGFSIQTKAED